MSIAHIRKVLLKNVPNIPKFGVTIDIKGHHAGHEVIRFKGKSYSVPMAYVIHVDCSKKLRALYTKAQHNSVHDSEHRKAMKPLLVFCPQCGAMAGKRVRDQLRDQGSPHTYHSPGAIPNYKRFVASYYTFPKGVGYSLDGEVVSIESKWAKCLDGPEFEGAWDEDDAPEEESYN